jgi:hypothetical protein
MEINENEKFKLEKEDKEEEDNNNNIYDDNYHDEIGQKIDNLNLLLEDKEQFVNNEILKYYNELKAKKFEYKNIFIKLDNNFLEQTLLYEKVTNEISLLNIKISEYKDEIRQTHEDTANLKNYNPTIKEIIKNPFTEKIKNLLQNVDLTKIPKFNKQLLETRDIYVSDATNVIRVNIINIGKRW